MGEDVITSTPWYHRWLQTQDSSCPGIDGSSTCSTLISRSSYKGHKMCILSTIASMYCPYGAPEGDWYACAPGTWSAVLIHWAQFLQLPTYCLVWWLSLQIAERWQAQILQLSASLEMSPYHLLQYPLSRVPRHQHRCHQIPKTRHVLNYRSQLHLQKRKINDNLWV